VFHKSNIMDKLGRRTTADLTQYAIASGLINVKVPRAETADAASEPAAEPEPEAASSF
jgi:hypothetical protein